MAGCAAGGGGVGSASGKDLLVSKKPYVFIDNSQSTSYGHILYNECKCANELAAVFSGEPRFFTWGTACRPVAAIAVKNTVAGFRQGLSSAGGTSPACIVSQLPISMEDCLFLFTDGEVFENDFALFNSALGSTNTITVNTPVVCVLVTEYGLDETLERIGKTVNMSVPLALMEIAASALVILNHRGGYTVLYSKGAFATVFRQPEVLEKTRAIRDYPTTSLLDIAGGLGKVFITRCPVGHVLFADGFSLEKGSIKLAECSISRVQELTNPIMLAQLGTDHVQALVQEGAKELASAQYSNTNSERRRLLLGKLVVLKRGTVEHQSVLDEFKALDRECSISRDLIERQKVLSGFMEMASEFLKDRFGLAFGSNRAIRAGLCDVSVLVGTNIDAYGLPMDEDHHWECPLLLDNVSTRCILIGMPEDKTKLLTICTSDVSMEAPFALGQYLAKTLAMPGMVSRQAAEVLVENPFTRQPIMGYLPLTSNVKVATASMSKLFGENKELLHFVRAYVAMVLRLSINPYWSEDERNALVQTANQISEHYSVIRTLKGQPVVGPPEPYVPLADALVYVMHNQAHLTTRTPEDVLTITKMVSTTGFTATAKVSSMQVTVARAMAHTFQCIQVLRRRLNDSPLSSLVAIVDLAMTLDDDGWYAGAEHTLQTLVAQLVLMRVLHQDSIRYVKINKNAQVFVWLKDTPVPMSLSEHQKLLQDYLNGTVASIAESERAKCLDLKQPDPVGSHFAMDILPPAYSDTEMRTCSFCGGAFTGSELFEHLQANMGEYFFKGRRTVRSLVESGYTNKQEIMKKAFKNLMVVYGPRAKFLYADWTKSRMSALVDMFLASV